MGIRVNEHESLTLRIREAELTVETKALFYAWIEKHLGKPIANAGRTSAAPIARPGERYIGSAIEPSGRTRHIFLMPGDELKNWNDGMEWANGLGGDLPDRIEQAMLYAYVPEEFKKEAYWSTTQHADDSSYAWYQSFSSGNQSYYGKHDKLRVRAVRREFSDSVIQ